MSFSLANGFSDGALTPTRALVAGLFIGGAVIVGLWTYGGMSRLLARDPSVAPACYGAVPAGGFARVDTRLSRKGVSKEDERLWNGPRDDASRFERIKAAEFICTAKSCDRKAWEQYRSALFWYLADRLGRTRRLVDVFGDKGLARAHALFGGEADLRIERGLRERYNARVFRIADFRQNQDAITILLLKGGKGLAPCRAADKS